MKTGSWTKQISASHESNRLSFFLSLPHSFPIDRLTRKSKTWISLNENILILFLLSALSKVWGFFSLEFVVSPVARSSNPLLNHSLNQTQPPWQMLVLKKMLLQQTLFTRQISSVLPLRFQQQKSLEINRYEKNVKCFWDRSLASFSCGSLKSFCFN